MTDKRRLGACLTADNWASLFALVMLTVFVLWVPATGYASIVAPKHRLFLSICAVFFPILLILSFRSRPKAAPLPLGLCLGLLVLFFLSACSSEYRDTVWLGARRNEGFLTLALYLLIFAAMSLWGKVGKIHLRAIAVTCLLVYALAMLQWNGGNPLGLYPKDYTFHDRGILYSGEYLSTIGNSDLLSAFLTMAFLCQAGSWVCGDDCPLTLAGAFSAWGCLVLSEVSAGPAAIFAALAICLPICLSRGIGGKRLGDILILLLLGLWGKSLLGYAYADRQLTFFLQTGPAPIALGLGLAGAVILRQFFPEGPHRKLAIGLVIAYGIGAAAIFLFLFFYSGSNATLQGLHLLTRGNPPDTLGSSRIRIWREAISLGLEKPLLGSGPDTYRFRSQIVFSKTSSAGKLLRTTVDAAHSEYLNLWVNTGLPSMILMLGLVSSVILPALRQPSRKTLPLVLPCLGYAIHALFGISQSLVSPLYYLFLGALVYAQSHENDPERSKNL